MNLFTDPVVAAPMWGCLLMGVASALVGVLIYVRRRSLVGETLSHAAYPGIVLSALLMSSPWAALLGASLSGLLGLYFVQVLERRFRVSSDTALCFVLSTFLGVGVLLASRMQFTEPVAFQKVQALLYGQAATMLIVHVYGYALLTLAIVLFILIFRRALQVVNFDRDFSKVCGLSVTVIDGLTMGVIVLATVMGIRSVGVVLMAGMLIAPAVAARPFVNSFGKMLSVSVLMGLAMGFFGMLASVETKMPTGPMIILVATGIVLLSAGQSLVRRLVRRSAFKVKCIEENVLKYLYKGGAFSELAEVMHVSRLFLRVLLWNLSDCIQQGALTELGKKRAQRIVRLHRLWEVYLVTQLDVLAEDVHRSAEEMEHKTLSR